MSFNKIILVGNLGRDPELRYTPQGTPVCSFSLATNEKRKDKNTGENNDITTWFRVTLWGRQAETASQYLSRGRPVYIEGRLRVEEWDTGGTRKRKLTSHARCAMHRCRRQSLTIDRTSRSTSRVLATPPV